MRQYGYLVVEGPHDVEFCYRLFSTYGLTRIQQLELLDDFLKSLVPSKFPHGGDLLKRVPVPLFLQSESHAIAIHSAIGDSRLVDTLQENLSILDASHFSGLGIILDSDSNKSAAERYDSLRQKVADADFGLHLPGVPGEVSPGTPRFGAFVLPDNLSQGTLEDLLLESAEVHYSALLLKASDYVDTSIRDNLIPADHLKDINKPAGRNKAVIGAVASLFKPGKSIQTSIQDNNWFRGNALTLPRINSVQSFFGNLFSLTQIATTDS